MNITELLQEAFGRIGPRVASAVEGLGPDDLAWRPDAGANSIAWLAWHLTRVQDDHIAEVADREQVWTSQGFARRFDLPFDDSAIGYGQSSDEVGQVRVESPQLLTEYLDAVLAATQDYLGGVSADDLDRVVDDRWDPPVTLAVRLVSVLNDDLEHAGQASYVRGLLDRRELA
jgi:uncharacterized damage-inducible protein DinB